MENQAEKIKLLSDFPGHENAAIGAKALDYTIPILESRGVVAYYVDIGAGRFVQQFRRMTPEELADRDAKRGAT